MSTPVATTLKIAADLKRRVVAAAKAADKSPHAFMLEAIEHQTRLDEQRRLEIQWIERLKKKTFVRYF